MIRRWAAAIAIVGMLGLAQAAQAQTLVATDAGFYNNFGIHNAANESHLVGVEPGIAYTGFVTFNVPSGPALATVQLVIPADSVSGGPNTLELYDVTASEATVRSETPAGPAGIAIHTDLGSGTLLGAQGGVTTGSTITVTLNPAGVALVNAARGGPLVLGMRNATTESAIDTIFGFSSPASAISLVTTAAATVPTLSEWAMILFGTALAGLAGLFVRRRQRLA